MGVWGLVGELVRRGERLMCGVSILVRDHNATNSWSRGNEIGVNAQLGMTDGDASSRVVGGSSHVTVAFHPRNQRQYSFRYSHF